MNKHRLEIGAPLASRTLAETVRRIVPGSSWNQARELCRRGKVRRNGEIVTDAALRLKQGDQVEVDLHAKRVRQHVLDDSAVVHVDSDVVVVMKPAGLLSVPFEDGDKNTLVDRLRFWLRRKTGFQGAELGVVQRLDKDTTGLLVFARNLAAKRHLQQLLRRHAVERRYLALAHGHVAAERCDTLLIADRGDGLRGSFGRFRRARGRPPATAERAITEVTPIEHLRDATLVECRLETGRQHQIRIHLSELGHPLIGERVYIRDYRGPVIEAPRPMLHAETLGFTHPRTQKPLRFSTPPPADFVELLQQLQAAR